MTNAVPTGFVFERRLPQHPLMRIILATLLVVAGCSPVQESDQPVSPNYEMLSTCERPSRAELTSIYAESLCGTITVFEDRSAAAGRTIDLNIMVIPATDSRVKGDPLFFLAGGPGQAATDVAGLFMGLRDLRRDRDIVLVDQRGTGASNSLACHLDIDGMESLGTDLDQLAQMQLDTLRKCLENFDADPSLYTTPIAMDDLNEVRETLGFPTINLYGISYGTRAALVYLRRHPETVRSVILDSVVPLTMSIPENVAIDAQSAFDQLVADCKADPGCSRSYPDVAGEYRRLRQRLELTAEEVELTHPRTGKRVEGVIGPRLVSGLVRSVMYSRELSALLPLAIHEAYLHNYEPMVALAYAFSGDDPMVSNGMMASVLCAADMRRVSSGKDAPDFENALFEAIKPICDFWPIGELPADYFEPVASDVPVLLLSGTLDPITPPRYGEEAAATLSNSVHVIVPGVGHGVGMQGCLPDVMAEFLDDPSPDTLNTNCAIDLKRPRFFSGFGGPVLAVKDPAKTDND